ncbi:hypothetical protein ABB02_00331 [Clostridiaceae bacterium JG1575]|nr:hypothetical protein ABB02_00331 [Clostridiaceae bacterium JG1575]
MFYSLLRLQSKRTLRQIPYLLTAGLLLFALAASMAVLSSRIVYGPSGPKGLRIGIAAQDSGRSEALLIAALNQQKSLNRLFSFEAVDEVLGKKRFEEGVYGALILMPRGFLPGILRGEPLQSTVLLPKGRPLEESLVRLALASGESMLLSGREAIWAADEVYEAAGRSASEREELSRALNEDFLARSLARHMVFVPNEVAATGAIPAGPFFLSTWILLFLLFLGLPLSFLLQPLPLGMQWKLTAQGLGPFRRLLADLLLVTSLLFAPLLLLYGVFLSGAGGFTAPGQIQGDQVLLLLALAFAIAAFLTLVYGFFDDVLWAMMTLFLTSLILVFFAGGFLPYAFMPRPLQLLVPYLPSFAWIQGIAGILLGGSIGIITAKILAWGGLFVLGAGLWRSFIQKRRRSHG